MRLALLCLLAAILAAPALGARSASADCARPRGEFLPPRATHLPARGVVYLIIPETPQYYTTPLDEAEGALVEDTLEVRGATFSARILQEDRFSTVVRIDYRATAEQMTLRWTLDTEVLASYQISTAPSDPNRATVTAVDRLEDEWSCSYSDTIDIALHSNAYRVAWEDGTTTFLSDQFFTSDPSLDTPLSQLVRLGHYSCLGYNVDPELLAEQRSFQLFALFADGTEAAFPVARTRLEDYAITLPTELVHTTASAAPSALLAPAPITTHLLGLPAVRYLLLVLALLGAAALALLTRRVIHRQPE
jgi:hypothetical protein